MKVIKFVAFIVLLTTLVTVSVADSSSSENDSSSSEETDRRFGSLNRDNSYQRIQQGGRYRGNGGMNSYYYYNSNRGPSRGDRYYYNVHGGRQRFFVGESESTDWGDFLQRLLDEIF